MPCSQDPADPEWRAGGQREDPPLSLRRAPPVLRTSELGPHLQGLQGSSWRAERRELELSQLSLSS